jgi:FAD/FMN-containing dehydrogenase
MTDVTPVSSVKLGPGGHWRNWVGNQSFVARHKADPSSEDELAALVQEASRQNLPIRVAGSGHSFTPVIVTSGLLLSLKNMQGLVSADLDRKRVVVRAGTRIGDIGRALKEIGLSLANQGDIDTQAIAGALSTGTHGTGIGLGCLSSQAVGMRLVQPDGSVLEIDGTGIPKPWPPLRCPSACLASFQRSHCRRSPLTISRKPSGARISTLAWKGTMNWR